MRCSDRTDQETGTRPVYYRHSAVEHQFLLLEEGWFLALNPTYHYTRWPTPSPALRPTTSRGSRSWRVTRQSGAPSDSGRTTSEATSTSSLSRINAFDSSNVDVDHGIDDRSWGKLPQEGPKAEPQAGSLLALHEEAS